MTPHPLTNFEIEPRYYQNEPRFNGVYSRDNPPKTKINIDDYSDIETHWVALYALNNKMLLIFIVLE